MRTSDESTDKIEGSVVWHTWTNHEILALLVKRIESYFERAVDQSYLLGLGQWELASYLKPIIEPRFTGRGHWADAPIHRVLMSLIRKRPRDLVKLCTLAARRAHSRRSQIIQTQDFETIFEEYSQGRIQDTINEYGSELPDIDRLLMNMKPSHRERTAKQGYVYRTDALLLKIENVLQGGDFHFTKLENVSHSGEFRSLNSRRAATKKELAAFLFKINFLTARKELPDGGILRKYFEENRYLSSEFVDFGFDWEIHPAYRWALQPDTIFQVFDSLQLGSDEEGF